MHAKKAIHQEELIMKRLLAFIAIGLLGTPIMAQADPTLVFDASTGELVGVNGVDVGGTLYDAEFADGSCVSVFDGCDDVSDLAFDVTTVAAATQALVDALNANSFVSPELVAGCGDASFCGLFTPYGYISASVLMSGAGIRPTGVTNQGVQIGALITTDYSSVTNVAWVKWSVASSAPTLSCAGFTAPADRDVQVNRPNRVVPLRMQLLDEFEAYVGYLESPPVLRAIYEGSSSDPGDLDDLDTTGRGDEGNMFAFDGTNWAFNLSTRGMAKGAYVLSAVSGDESEYLIDPTCEVKLVIR